MEEERSGEEREKLKKMVREKNKERWKRRREERKRK